MVKLAFKSRLSSKSSSNNCRTTGFCLLRKTRLIWAVVVLILEEMGSLMDCAFVVELLSVLDSISLWSVGVCSFLNAAICWATVVS